MDNYVCPICGKGMIWDSDSDSDECGYAVEGSVTFCHCDRCNAQVEIFIPLEDEK